MSPEALQSLIDKLDAELPHEGASLMIRQIGGGPDECEIHANPAGYARFGLEFLRASAVPPEAFDAAAIEARLERVVDPKSDVQFCWFERHDTLPTSPTSPMPAGAPKPWQMAMVMIFVGWVLMTLVIGGIVSIDWVVQLVRGFTS